MTSLRESSGTYPIDNPDKKLLRTYEGMLKLHLRTAMESAPRLSNEEDRDAFVQALQAFSDTQDQSILFARIRDGGPTLATALHETTGSGIVWRDLSELALDIKKLNKKIPASLESEKVPPTTNLQTGTGAYGS